MKLVKIVKRGGSFELRRTGKRFFIRCLKPHAYPRGRRISASDATYLQGLSTVKVNSPSEFDCACVMDFGVGVFARGGK